ncbi:MBL fold metallo-hydrolase [Kineococcus glutinatus]|uniref:Metallo-beta-lactamase domain-containing protein n=1 Tax=Kineococcus glutinatus TaxID=1070872 RepID=A0ABP9HQT5_9ACTN
MCDTPTGTPEDVTGAAAPGTSRRHLLQSALTAGRAALAVGALGTARPAAARAAATGTAAGGDRIVVLGLDGGPKINTAAPPLPSAKPALALVAGGSTYLVDCGLDTTRQLVRAGLSFADVHDVLLTHHHLDHTSGLPGLALHSWTTTPARGDLRVWGPPSTSRQVKGVKAAFGEEVDLFESGGGFGAFPGLRGHDVTIPRRGGIQRVLEDGNVVVHATRVFHGPEVEDAYAYRFTVKRTGKVVVFSGDTAAPDAALIELAHGCDVLVHEAQDNDNVEKIVASIPDRAQAAALRTHLLESHSNVADLPGVARAAEARTLVLSHYTPLPQPPSVYLAKARAAAERVGYRGRIVAPAELDVIAL